MAGVRPPSNRADSGPNPSNLHPLQLDQPDPHDLEGPMQPSSDMLTSVVFLASDSALQLHLDGTNLLFQPQPTSILQVSLPGHMILLVPEGLQASILPGHLEFSPTRPLGSALLDLPREHIVIEPGSISASSGEVPDCWSPSDSPSADSYDPWSTWSLKESMLAPLPGSPLQPLPASPPSSPQEEGPLRPVSPTCPPCKARRRLF